MKNNGKTEDKNGNTEESTWDFEVDWSVPEIEWDFEADWSEYDFDSGIKKSEHNAKRSKNCEGNVKKQKRNSTKH